MALETLLRDSRRNSKFQINSGRCTVDNQQLKLLIATNNAGKLVELRALLNESHVQVTSPSLENIDIEVEENGSSLKENASLKAKEFNRISGLPSLSDDSGLFVAHLNGRPGIHSARYAGPNGSDDDLVDKLLNELDGVEESKRTAYFECVIAIIDDHGEEHFFSGRCEGTISTQRKGNNGFGYDPVFFIPKLDKTMAELTESEKNDVSHRSKAMKQAIRFIDTMGINT